MTKKLEELFNLEETQKSAKVEEVPSHEQVTSLDKTYQEVAKITKYEKFIIAG